MLLKIFTNDGDVLYNGELCSVLYKQGEIHAVVPCAQKNEPVPWCLEGAEEQESPAPAPKQGELFTNEPAPAEEKPFDLDRYLPLSVDGVPRECKGLYNSEFLQASLYHLVRGFGLDNALLKLSGKIRGLGKIPRYQLVNSNILKKQPLLLKIVNAILVEPRSIPKVKDRRFLFGNEARNFYLLREFEKKGLDLAPLRRRVEGCYNGLYPDRFRRFENREFYKELLPLNPGKEKTLYKLFTLLQACGDAQKKLWTNDIDREFYNIDVTFNPDVITELTNEARAARS